MPKWCMSCNGQAMVTDDIAPNTCANVRRLKRMKVVVCGRCWRKRTWEY